MERRRCWRSCMSEEHGSSFQRSSTIQIKDSPTSENRPSHVVNSHSMCAAFVWPMSFCDCPGNQSLQPEVI